MLYDGTLTGGNENDFPGQFVPKQRQNLVYISKVIVEEKRISMQRCDAIKETETSLGNVVFYWG